MGIIRNGAIEFQAMEQGLSDSLALAGMGLRNSVTSSAMPGQGAMVRQFLDEDYTKRLLERQMMQEGLNKVRSQGGGSMSGSASYGRGGVEKGPRGGGMSPHEQQQMQEQASARAAAAERAKLKQQRADDRLHMNNLLFDYEQAKKRNGRPGGSAGSKGNRGDEGYTEQIFNSAGAPEVVRLKNYTPDRGTEAADMQAIMNILMGAK